MTRNRLISAVLCFGAVTFAQGAQATAVQGPAVQGPAQVETDISKWGSEQTTYNVIKQATKGGAVFYDLVVKPKAQKKSLLDLLNSETDVDLGGLNSLNLKFNGNQITWLPTVINGKNAVGAKITVLRRPLSGQVSSPKPLTANTLHLYYSPTEQCIYALEPLGTTSWKDSRKYKIPDSLQTRLALATPSASQS